MADIVIGGRLHSAATGNTVAGANEIMDDAQGKKQSVVNQELANRISENAQQQQAAIEAEAEARAAKDRELKALIDQGIIEGGGIVFDTEPTPDSVNPVTSNGIAGTLGYNTDNVEFVRVVVDSQNRVVFGIQRDGNVYFGAGVPRQIQDYVRDMMATIDLTDITTTLEQITDYLAGKLGTQLTLSDELDGKVDKEEGKSLIDAEVAESFSTADNPEFVKVVTDSEDKMLAGIKKDGKVWLNDLEVDGKAFYEVVDNSEWLIVWTDADDKVLMGIRRNGKVVLGDLEVNLENTKRYVTVDKNGLGDYTSFVRAIMDNYGKWGVTIHLNEGEYDLFEEFEEYYGTADFLNLTKYGRGLELGYNITVEGSPKSIIKADYTGNDANVQEYFSPINCTMDVNGGGYTLRGINIRCSRVRYAVHDEKATIGLGNYSNVYDNCNFYIDNTDNDTWHSSQCIGGGLGTSGNIVVKNCIFESVDPAFNDAAVSWHNNRNEGAKSQISCIGNVVNGNRGFRFSWYGYSQEITEVICTGNNVGAATIIRPETGPDSPFGPSPYENIEVWDWNNVIRN